jgi:hypothetical protein
MNFAAAIEALRREICETDDDGAAVAAALTGLRVLSALLAPTQHSAAPALAAEGLDTISESYPQPPALDVRKIGADVLAALAADDAATQRPQPPSARPLPVASPASDADPPSPAEAPAPAAVPVTARTPSTKPKRRYWTPRMLEMLASGYPEDDLDELLARINAESGGGITKNAMGQAAFKRGIRRAPHLLVERNLKALVLANAAASPRRTPVLPVVAAPAPQPAQQPDHVPDAPKMAEPEPPPPAPSKPTLRDRVAAAMARGVKDWSIWASQQGVSLHEVYRHTYSIQREQKEQAA